MKAILTAILLLAVGFVLFSLIAGVGLGPVEVWAYAVLSLIVLAGVATYLAVQKRKIGA